MAGKNESEYEFEYDKISYEIKDLVETHRQSGEVFKRKKMLRQIIYNMLRMHTEFPIDLYMVGSSLNGLGTNNSDIDLCLVVDSIGEKMCHLRYSIPVLKWAERILSRLPFVKNSKLILAKVPILKFTDSESGIEIDLNFNNIVGIRNTQLIEFYNRMDKRVQPLVLTAKTWARQNGINNARNKTISSYTIVLMVIHYLQCGCNPPVLPCLHKLMPDKFHPDSDITQLRLFEEIADWPLSNKSSLSQLFIGFLDYFSYKFDYVNHAISIRTGGTIAKSKAREYIAPKNNPKHWNYICVEEPFDRTNTAKAVYDEEAFNHILDVFRSSYAKIMKTQTLSSIILNVPPSLSPMSSYGPSLPALNSFDERFFKVKHGNSNSSNSSTTSSCNGSTVSGIASGHSGSINNPNHNAPSEYIYHPPNKVHIHDHYSHYLVYPQHTYSSKLLLNLPPF